MNNRIPKILTSPTKNAREVVNPDWQSNSITYQIISANTVTVFDIAEFKQLKLHFALVFLARCS